MGLRYRAGVCALALIAGSAVLQFEPTVVRDLVFSNGSQRVAIGAVKVSLWSAAFAQSADSFSLENVSFTLGSTTYEAKRIEFSGVSTPRAEIEALFSPNSTEPMEARLQRLSAKQVTVPEARVTQTFGKTAQTSTYRNVVFSDISQGRIASTTVEATAMEKAGGKGNILFSNGHTSLSDLDLPALARLYEAKADTSSSPLTKIYGAFSIDNIEMADSSSGVGFKVAHVSGRDFLGRPTKDSWSGTMGIFADLADQEKPSPEDEARLLPIFADFLDAFQFGFVEASGIDVSAQGTGQGTGKDKAAPFSAHYNRIAYTGSTDSQPADVRLEGLEFSGQDNRIKLDGLSLTGFSLRQTIDGLRALQGKSLKDLDPETLRSLVPTLGTLRLAGLNVDGTSEDEGKKVKFQAGLKGFELTADKPVNAIPTNVRIGLRNFTMTLPPNSQDDGIKQLLALDYKAVDLSLLADASWNEAANEITLKEVSVQGQDMGTVTMSGVIGNAGKDLFNADTAIATVALAGAKAKALDVTVENKGLFERYLAKSAKEQRTTPESLRRTYAGAAAFVVPAMIGNSDQAQALSQAIARFIAKPGRLTLHATPKNPSGFGLADAVALSDPKAMLDKLNVTAKAE